VELGETPEITKKFINWLLNRQERDGSWAKSLYITSQVVQALVKAGLKYQSDPIESALNWLEKASSIPLVRGVFEDFTHTIIAFIEATGNRESFIVQKILNELIKSPERLKKDGSWYEDIRCTAMALLALIKVGTRKIYQIPAGKLEELVLKNHEREKITSGLEQKVLEYIKANDYKISVSKCADTFGLTTETIRKIIESLVKKGKLEIKS